MCFPSARLLILNVIVSLLEFAGLVLACKDLLHKCLMTLFLGYACAVIFRWTFDYGALLRILRKGGFGGLFLVCRNGSGEVRVLESKTLLMK